MKLSCQPYVYYIYKQYAAAGACSARNLSRHFWAAYDIIHVNNTLPLAHEISRHFWAAYAWTTHSHSEKFNKMLKNFANFTRFSLLFSTKKATGSLVKLSEYIFKEFILCFQSYCVVFVLFFRGYVCNLGIYLPTLGKYVYMV